MIRSVSLLNRISLSVLTLAIAYTVLWSVEAGRMRTEVAGFMSRSPAHAITIGSYQLSIGGFPFWLQADFGKLSVDGLPYAEQLRIEAPPLIVRARPWRPTAWQFVAPEGFTLSDHGETGAAVTIAAGHARGRAGANVGDPAGIVLAIESYDLSLQFGSAATTAGHAFLQLIVPDKPPEDRTAPSLRFAAALDGALPPPHLGLPDRPITHLAVAGVVEGPMPAPPLVPALAAWREAGGSVELRDVALHWGTIDLAGDGTLTLDANLQPSAAFSGRIRGWEALLDDFVDAGTLTAAEAKYDRLGLGLLTRTADDGKNELKAAITLQNTQLYLGPAKIATLPLIDWQ